MNHISYRENLRSVSDERNRFLLSLGFRIFLTILALLLLGLYVVRMSTVSVKGYDISNLQKQVKALQEENQKLEFEIATSGSMQNIQARLKTIQFVPVEKPEYALITSPAIAQR